jgi:hypothetical protein
MTSENFRALILLPILFFFRQPKKAGTPIAMYADAFPVPGCEWLGLIGFFGGD